MATVGDQLALPESGWRRYDDTHVGLKYTGSWYKVTSTNYYNGSVNVTTRAADNNYVAFSFYGTKIRIISDIAQDRHSDNTIAVDGVTESFNTNKTGTGVLNAIVYEKMNLPLGFHTVTITVGHNRTNFIMDAIDIDDKGYLYGYTLATPESGWKRYDDTSSEIKYDGWLRYPTGQAGSYNNSFSASNNTANKKATFAFKGTKLRLITMTHSDSTTIGKISIDGTPYDASFYSSSAINQVLVFEKTGLEDSLHIIEIYSSEAKNIRIDAVDIDLDGRMFHPDEVTSIAELEVGKRIRCHYVSNTSGVAGEFKNIGKQTSDFISTTSAPSVPNGDFYFIVVDEYNKKKILIADRNIQSLSWDALNRSGLVFGVQKDLEEKSHMFVARLLSGGYSAADKDNEWDQYIVNSTLNGNIIAGDNSVWNWSGGNSIVSTTNANSANRVRRGSLTVSTLGAIATSSVGGYRPLIELKSLPMFKSFVKHDGAYKRLDTEALTWNKISATLPSEDTFINDGMDDLSVLDRKNKDFVQTMTVNGSLGSGKIFKGSIDLKKYFEITNINVK